MEKKTSLILIVDDTPRNIQVVGGILKKSIDCEFAFATNGAQALETVPNVKPDLILLDVMMPVMDGYQVCEELKRKPETRDIPIIFLTAKTQPEDIVKGFSLGAVDYVTKPFNPSELLARVSTQLKLKERNDIIVRQSREQRELLHVLCHDLANPIGTAKGMLELCVEDENLFDEFKDDLSLVLDNAIEIITLVRQMRALSEGKMIIRLEPVNLLGAIEKSILILKSKFNEKNIMPRVAVDASLRVNVEKTSFVNSVLNNIFTNAIKFSYPGKAIDIVASRDGDRVRVSFRDYGVGMPDTLAKDIFDVNKPTSREGTTGELGTGFGMPLVKRFVTSYGGDILVRSSEKELSPEDHGTEISLSLRAEN